MEVDPDIAGVERQYEYSNGRVAYLYPTIFGARLGIFNPKPLFGKNCRYCTKPYSCHRDSHEGCDRCTLPKSAMGVPVVRVCSEYVPPMNPSPDRIGYDEDYMFESFGLARFAAETWSGEGDPKHWVRHTPSNRRRPNGNPTKEYVEE